jgi:hypothetical protein
MKQLTIESVADLCRIVETSQFQDDGNTTVIYRGLADIDYDLRPKVGRFNPSPHSNDKVIKESRMLELFRRNSVGLTSHTLDDDWEFLAVAQHHGMPTRLMDWTRNPLVAAYFAVANSNQSYRKHRSSIHPHCYTLREPDSVIYSWRC